MISDNPSTIEFTEKSFSNLNLKKMCANLVDESCDKARAMYYRLLRITNLPKKDELSTSIIRI